MNKLVLSAVIAAVVMCIATSALAQEWTKEQTELWKVVEDSWVKWKEGDLDGMAAYFHEKYQGWSSDAPLPIGKTEIFKWYKEMKEFMKVDYISAEPARIVITKNAGVVDYYFSVNATYTRGEAKSSEVLKGKNAEFYVREDGKWLLLGDMTVFDPQKGK